MDETAPRFSNFTFSGDLLARDDPSIQDIAAAHGPEALLDVNGKPYPLDAALAMELNFCPHAKPAEGAIIDEAEEAARAAEKAERRLRKLAVGLHTAGSLLPNYVHLLTENQELTA